MGEQPEGGGPEAEISGVSEEEAFAKWREIGGYIDVLQRRTDTPGEWDARPGSSLAGDDARSKPYQVSHAINQCLMAAIDHAHAVKSLVLDHQIIHAAAPASLARGFLENMATAYWMLHPSSRPERITRVLRWHARNAHDQHEALRHLESLPTPRRSHQERVAHLRGFAQDRALDPEAVLRGYRPSTPIEYADTHAEFKGVGVRFAWQLCSGFAHGRPWAFLAVLAREQFESGSPDVLDVRLSNDFTRSLYPVLTGMHLTEEVLRLLERRRTPM